jgi:hypothetical protein
MGGIALILYPLTAFACGLTSGVAGFALGLPIFSGSPLAAPQRRLRGQTVLRATNGKFPESLPVSILSFWPPGTFVPAGHFDSWNDPDCRNLFFWVTASC